jgi:hypothetical protein
LKHVALFTFRVFRLDAKV